MKVLSKVSSLKKLLAIGCMAAMSLVALNAQAADEKKPPSVTATNPAATAVPKAMATADRMDINSASEADLATLTGIGEARSKAIIKGRPYSGKDDLVKKKIIPESVYDKIKDQIIARQK